MSELAKSHIEIIDDSSYGAGNAAIIPLYVFATEQDKVIDEDTNEIAPGTTKQVANEVVLLTSRKDVTDTYGIPTFTTVDGTVQQGDELNEVGLYGLYDALGNSSLAYAIRADIDLKQLKPSKSEPKGKVANQTLWFDMGNTSFGLFRANGSTNPANAWESVNVKPLNELPTGFTGYTAGDVVAVCQKDGTSQTIKFYEYRDAKWLELGSNDWKAVYGISARSKVNAYLTKESTDAVINVSINGVTVELGQGKSGNISLDMIMSDINAQSINGIVADVQDNALKITSTNGKLELSDVNGDAFKTLGFNMDGTDVVVHGASIVHSSHTRIPNGEASGSYWFKTTEPNQGSRYIMKQYVSSSDSWKSTTLNMYGSYLEAEAALGSAINVSSMIVKYEASDKADAKIMQYTSGDVRFKATNTNPELSIGDKLIIRTIENNEIKKYEVRLTGKTAESLAKDINNLNSKVINAYMDNGVLNIDSLNEHTIELSDDKDNIVKILPALSSELTNVESVEITKWVEPKFVAKVSEPTADASFGTYWFNDNMNADIMVNDGSKWVGFKNYTANECAEIIKSADEPENHTDGGLLQENDLWISTASENYPTIYRYTNGEWVLIDNTDQTTPYGIVFADARENAGPSANFATSEQSMALSDYVDPNCVNPLSYPAGILLFNTLYSTNNVKVFVDEYANAVKELGATYKVGESEEFPTPGSATNPKTTRWETASGNSTNGAGLFGRQAQRGMIVKALQQAVNSNEDIRSQEYDFMFACCPGYPELDDELIALNTEKKEMFYTVSDTPARLAPKATEIIKWASNKNNASTNGENGRTVRNAYMTRQYPPMGLTSNVDGTEIAVPSSIAKMRNLLTLPRGRFAAGTQYGQVRNLASVGYITNEDEYAPVSIRDGIGEVIVAQSMNPIMSQRNTGLLFWGESTENGYTSSLSDEHAILTILRMKRELEEACLPFFFQPNTDAVRKDFDATLRSILNDYVGREELYDYTLVTDRSVNTNERIERKELWAEIAVEIVKGIEQIYIPIRIVKTGSLSATA